jgi:PAS domain S-box-containing protein
MLEQRSSGPDLLQAQAVLVYQALDGSDDIVLLIESSDGSDPVIVGANGAFSRATGYVESQLVGRKVAELLPVGNAAEKLTGAVRNGKALREEFVCARADGGTFMLGLHLLPAPSPTSGRTCMVILGRDITEALEARRTHNSIQGLLTQVFISIDEGVAIVDAQGRILLTNPHISRLLGYAQNELVGRSSLSVVVPRAREQMEQLRQQQAEHGGRMTYDAPLLKADGSEFLSRITSAPVEREDLKRFRILTIRPAADAAQAMRSETAGRIKLVGLDEVRAALGERWEALAERAMATAEAVIKRRCGPHDTHSRIDGTSFLICFGDITEQEASFRAAVIGREIRERLIGLGHDPAAAQVRAIAATLSVPHRPGDTPASLRGALLDGLNGQLARLEQEARHTLRAAITSPTSHTERISGRNPEETVATLVRLPDALERKIVCALSVLPENETDLFDLDGLLLGMAAQQVIAAMNHGDTNTPVLVNVRFDVFGARATTERYTALCGSLDARVCSRLILLLSGLPEGLPATRLLEWVNRLRPFCRSVGFQVEGMRSLMALDLTHFPNPIVALPPFPLAANATNRLRDQIRSLHARRAKVLVRRVLSEDDAGAYLALGADMISMERPS